MTWLAIDPGLDTGWAVLSDAGELVSCGVATLETLLCRGACYRGAVIERPEVYPKDRVNPNDLITLAIQVGRYTERLHVAGVPFSHVLPKQWKGQVPKLIHHARIKNSLAAGELTRVEDSLSHVAAGIRHNAWDAIGLAKWAWKSKVFAR